MAIFGSNIAFGITEGVSPEKLRGFPEGKVRIRFRPEDFAQVFVKTEDGIIGYYVRETKDGFIEPFIIFGQNIKNMRLRPANRARNLNC